MEIIYYPLIFIAGLFFGSFLNLVADRSVKGEPILFGRSHCDFCNKVLQAIDLIPLLSFLSTRGKCRYCKEGISSYYPVSELLTGAAFVATAYISGIFTVGGFYSLFTFMYLTVVASVFIVLLMTDLKYRLIPDKVVIPGILFILIYTATFITIASTQFYYQLKNDDFGVYLLESGYWHMQVTGLMREYAVTVISALAIGFFFWFLVYITKGRGMGGGDIRLAVMIGLFNGFSENVLAIFLGFVFGAVFSGAMILFRRKSIKDTIAFGPFLILGSVVAFMYGRTILQWYFNLM
jgi:prepilin signal peptidase PulO-like enzyme (type II secretory pathway)